jgi:hypothetical protein
VTAPDISIGREKEIKAVAKERRAHAAERLPLPFVWQPAGAPERAARAVVDRVLGAGMLACAERRAHVSRRPSEGFGGDRCVLEDRCGL